MLGPRGKTILLALALDVLFGDPPNRIHPVAWMGKLIAYLVRYRPKGKPLAELIYGGTITLGGCCLFFGIGKALENRLNQIPGRIHDRLVCRLIEAVLLKSTFSLRGLNQAAIEVENALESGNVPAARDFLARNLVSRNTSRLDGSLISAAAIESIAENTSDGFLAPLFFYATGGLGMAFAYRFANTADSMLGYHTPELEWLGKVPARWDDLLNYLPARMTAGSIALSAPFVGGNAGRSWEIVRNDACKTESPNAGYPMSAMAGALGVELEKTGYYRLGAGGRKPETGDIRRARRVMFIAAALGTIMIIFLPRWSRSLCLRKRDRK